MKSRSRKK